jgi:hypothetical protein
MKIFAVATIALLLLFAPAVCAKGTVVSTAASTTHEIEMSTLVSGAKCSATAIGPHALLTASHCEQPTNDIQIDGKDATILFLKRDGGDHTIYFVDLGFKSWATVNESIPEMGDGIFIIGNPGELNHIYRHGYVSLVNQPNALEAALAGEDASTAIAYDINGYFGDSGAAVFNEAGEVSGVLSLVDTQTKKDAERDGETTAMKMMYGFAFKFSADDLKQAQTYVPVVAPKK